jgi:hypothetical protein
MVGHVQGVLASFLFHIVVQDQASGSQESSIEVDGWAEVSAVSPELASVGLRPKSPAGNVCDQWLVYHRETCLRAERQLERIPDSPKCMKAIQTN